MSADNWAICPKCRKLEEEETSPYGKVSEEEYKEYLEKYEDRYLDTTLREDYWQGIDEYGFYKVSYHGRCDECGLDFDYEYKVNVLEAKDGK